MALLQNLPQISDPFKGRTVGKRYQAVFLMLLTSTVLVGAFGSRLAQLQLVEGDRNRQLAENNRIRLVPKRPARGALLDRNGKILAGSRLSHSISIWPIALPKSEWPTVTSRLSSILNIPEDEIRGRLEQAGYESIESITIARGISPAQATALAEYGDELKGVRLEAEAVRNYPHGDLAAHILGYTGELTDDQFKARDGQGYRLGDVVGQMGAEAAFESQLRGEWGGQQVEVDSAGRVLRILGDKPAKSGNDVQLTLDLELQKAAEAALGERTGAIVVMDPNNGAILAMASRPTFDPNIFSTRITEDQWAQLQGETHPFLNRALQGFPPASTFKIVTTAAALESGSFSPNTVLSTFPYITVGGIQFWDWNNAGFGPLGFTGAMAMSSDTFFYQVAMRMKEKPLIEMTRRFGFGKMTGIEIPNEESPGLVPDDAWKQKNLGEEWTLGDTINMSIGQGFLQTTPLQVAVMFAIAANGGYQVKPHMLRDNEETKNWQESINLSSVTIDILQRGLREVISNGTAKALNDPSIPPVAGKTGTAEAPPYQSHTWFGAYAPADKPEIVVVSFGEHSGGGGGSIAAPMAKKVLDVYFKKPQAEQTPTATSTPSD
ncbi:penicillin-binding protein 2 [Pseudanabaena sp. FACHB-2040]|uniref:penicillin-binding protein 2 n=1 Tax=Pseudanabaena sp. FACHB-2040 TaxID=2692859 RepID=UPI00168261C7|nr:penicillin-binding protein 2 [Pseudanabaena sp. FACHB-2040]MBD2260161.1 penicillin-binding protein 2 [Pseudanabaena sp. FACHB-2040]